jgi:aminopeptidase
MYIRLLVEHGAGLREGQELFIHGEWAHRDLAQQVAEVAYDRGALAVNIFLKDPLQRAQLIRRGTLERIELAHEDERRFFNRMVSQRGALISLRGDERPELMPELAKTHPRQHEVYTRSSTSVARIFHLHGINRGLCPWVVAGAPTLGWASRVLPSLAADPQEALDKLWALIFRFTGADQENALEVAKRKDRHLHARRGILNGLEIEELHVTGGGSDLRVGLTTAARWLGGSKQTLFGQTFNANVPSEENYTTPDCRRTEGRLRATMPFRTKSGILIKDLLLDFKAGRVVSFSATEGSDGFRRWIDSDQGARALGEIALVGQDSPIAASGHFFEHILFDENASCHAALGKAYATALEGGPGMSLAELTELGCNDSVIHTDIMFGSTEVSVTATRCKEGSVPLIENGQWSERLMNPKNAGT